MTVTYTVGDTREVIKSIPDGSVDLIASSPPFLALRSYVPADHESKGDEIGSEANPAAFIDMLLGLTAEWGRVLAPHGSIAIELGDTYSGSSEGEVKQPSDAGKRYDNHNPAISAYGSATVTRVRGTTTPGGTGWPRAKSLALIPQLYAVALAYGINPLTGQASPAGRWLVRNVIVWHRPNPAVGALGDKVRPSTSYIVIATRSAKRWFDLSAVRSGADSLRPTAAAVPSVSDTQEVATTFGARSRNPARGWCQPGSSKITLDPSVTWHAKRLQVVEPIGFLVGVEQHERPQMMDLQSLARPADLTLVAVTAQRILAGDWPVTTSIVGAPALEAGMVIASDIDGPPLTGTLEAAEVVSQRLAPVAGHWLAAEITLKVNGADATAYAIAPVGGSVPHTNQFTSNHADLGKYRKVGSAGASESRTAGGDFANPDKLRPLANPAGAPPLDAWFDSETTDVVPFDPYDGSHDTWTLTTQPSKLCHYAMWPAKLAERLVLMMCPREVCRVCGEPRRRVEGKVDYLPSATYRGGSMLNGSARVAEGVNQWIGNEGASASVVRSAPTLGWTSCNCPCPTCEGATQSRQANGILTYCPDCTDGRAPYRPGLVLDPFCGSGTTMATADLHGRDAIGIDFDARNKAIYPARYDEVSRALFGTKPELPGQGDLFADPRWAT